MSPEVVEDTEYGLALDIWSLGIASIQMCDGQPPRSNVPFAQLVELIKRGGAPEPAHREQWSPELLEFVALCLRRDPEARPSAEALMRHPFVQLGVDAEDDTRAQLADMARRCASVRERPVPDEMHRRLEYGIEAIDAEGGGILNDLRIRQPLTRDQLKSDTRLAATQLAAAAASSSSSPAAEAAVLTAPRSKHRRRKDRHHRQREHHLSGLVASEPCPSDSSLASQGFGADDDDEAMMVALRSESSGGSTIAVARQTSFDRAQDDMALFEMADHMIGELDAPPADKEPLLEVLTALRNSFDVHAIALRESRAIAEALRAAEPAAATTSPRSPRRHRRHRRDSPRRSRSPTTPRRRGGAGSGIGLESQQRIVELEEQVASLTAVRDHLEQMCEQLYADNGSFQRQESSRQLIVPSPQNPEEQEKEKEEKEEENGAIYDLARLQESPFPEDVDPCQRERYLSDEQFEALFTMTRDQFYALSQWRQWRLKQNHRLF
jgi:Protein kinase domain/Villin headpiece domain